MAAKIALIGLGPHARRIHLHYFKKYNISPQIIVDLESQKDEVLKVIEEYGFKDTEIVLIPDKYKDDETLNNNVSAVLKGAFGNKKVSHVFLSTEPKAHNMYLEFCLKNDVNVLSDKPITAFKDANSFDNADKAKKQYMHLVKLYGESNARCHILCQRQFHRGYMHIKEELSKVIKKYNIPITSIEISHCDGKWLLPHDMDTENHPYKYGYGKLFHSGYHFIQILSDLLKLNDLTTENKHIENMRMYNYFLTPNDELSIITNDDLKKLFNTKELPDHYKKDIKFDNYGEKNFNSSMVFTNREGKTITMATLNMQQLGFSRRDHLETNEDMYKNNGRVRHESVTIQVGPLMCIKISSYQSKEIKDRTMHESLVGGLEHFDIDIFRNTGLIGGDAHEHIKLKDLYKGTDKKLILGYNEYAREEAITDFLKSRSKVGDLRDHGLAIEILNTVSKSLSNHYHGKNKEQKVKIKELI